MNKAESDKHFSLEALKAGDRAEFARLVEAYSPKIYHLLLRMTGNDEDAEDMLQETFLKAYRSLEKFEGRSSLSTWLYRIAVNEALMLFRQKQPQLISIDQEIPSEEGDIEPLQIVDWHELPEEELVSAETRQKLDEAIRHLPQVYKVVFLLRDTQDFSIKETADILGLTEAAVKTRLARARLHLREDLSTYFKERIIEKP